MSARVFFYVQHLLGIGHLARASLIARALLKQGFSVDLVMGGMPVSGFPCSGVDIHQLPPLRAGKFQFNELIGEDGSRADTAYFDNRRDRLVALYEDRQPDIIIIEAFPFARRQMRFELLPLLERAVTGHKRPFIAASVRDIVQVKTKPGRNEETVSTLNRYFDAVLVHGDPQFARLDETFPLAGQISQMLHYTGIVAGGVPPLSGPAYDVIVSAGGGAAGELLMRTALAARPKTVFADASWCILTGPNLPPQTAAGLAAGQPGNVSFAVQREDFRAALAHARLSVSQAGYNTAADVLQAGCAALMVPFSQGGETEQVHRVKKLVDRNLVISVSETGLTPENMAAAINAAAVQSPRPEHAIDLDGAASTARILKRLVKQN